LQQRNDYLIIGAGPAGLQLGYFLEKAGRDYRILEAGAAPGTFFTRFPRHRKLISVNKVYTGFDDDELNLRWDWNSLLGDSDAPLFKDYNKQYFPPADTMVEYLGAFAAHHGLNIAYDTTVVNIARDGDFQVIDQHGITHTCARLIIATGVHKPYIPAIPGIELAEPYTDVSVEPHDFVNKRVLIIGKGNSAFETADNLIETAALIHLTSPNPLKFAWKTHYVGHLRAVNNNFLDTYLLKTQNGTIDGTIREIERVNNQFFVTVEFSRARGTGQFCYDRVILCSGFRFDTTIFDATCQPQLTINDRFPAQTSEWESVNVPDLFFAGTLMQMRDFKKTQSGFIHGFRYNVRALHRMLEARYQGNDWPHTTYPIDVEVLALATMDRINHSSALWQQSGFLCDLLCITEDEQVARYYTELPTAYVAESPFGQSAEYYTIKFDYGPDYADYPFEFERYVDADKAHLNPQLHPIIRHYRHGMLVSEHHLMENIEGRWPEPHHVGDLCAFFGAGALRTS
jgi:thioredoxin reductase